MLEEVRGFFAVGIHAFVCLFCVSKFWVRWSFVRIIGGRSFY